MKKVINNIFNFFEKLKNDHVSEYAAECAYFTILSFIPFIIIFITLIQYTIVDKTSFMEIIKIVVPSNMSDFVIAIIQEVYSKSAGTISVAALIALWSAGKGFFALCKGFEVIYDIEKYKTKPNFIIRIRATLYALVFSLTLITVLILRVFGNRIYNIILVRFYNLGVTIEGVLRLRSFLLIAILTIIFIFIYKFLPRRKLKLKEQIYGAVFSSLTCYILSWFFSIYVDIFKGFPNTYGSLTTVILIMMWLYYCMYSILVGAEINTLLYDKKNGENIKK